jgi:hypothetical protein
MGTVQCALRAVMSCGWVCGRAIIVFGRTGGGTVTMGHRQHPTVEQMDDVI